ncbi:hypothetical protein [Mycoplasma sp. Sp33II]|uniref:hypothetical protein n=1 Tax=unclassified Mycoplasma TaxID=2683645 RepID=UPI003AAE64EC
MSEKNKNGKAMKKLLAVVASGTLLASPLLILAGNENAVENDGISLAFNPDLKIQGNVDTKEYVDIQTRYFGVERGNEKIYLKLPNGYEVENSRSEIEKTLNAQKEEIKKLVNFKKEPTQQDWNLPEQTWEIAYDTGLLNGSESTSYGQRAFGFALSNDLEVIPGTISLRLEYANKNLQGKFKFYDDGVTWGDPDSIDGIKNPLEKDFFKYDHDTNISQYDKIKGLYLRFADKNKKFDFSAEQSFDHDSYWMKNMIFDTSLGSISRGNLLYSNYDKDANDRRMEINIFPAITGYWGSSWPEYRPRINGIEYITSDVDKANLNLGAHSPYAMDELLSRNLASNFGKDDLYHVFGVAIAKDPSSDPNQWSSRIYAENKKLDQFYKLDNFYTYNQFNRNAGTTFLINLDNGFEQTIANWNKWLNDAKKAYKIYLKFKTRRRMSNVYSGSLEGESNRKVQVNSFLNKNTPKSFVSALYHADYYNKDKRFESSSASTSPIENGYKYSQFSAEATSFATRTTNRNVRFNITETFSPREGKNDKFPKISGFNVYKNGQKIDSIKVQWDDIKNNSRYTTMGKFKTELSVNLDTLNLSNIEDLNELTLSPYYTNDNSERHEALFKWNVSSTKFNFNKEKDIISGTINYTISPEQIRKEELDDKLAMSQLPSDLLFDNTPLTSKQRGVIRGIFGTDYERKRFDGKTVKTGDTTLYNGFWVDLIKGVSKANKEKEKIMSLDTTNIINSVNYRLSDNKLIIDELIKKIKNLKEQDLDNFKIGIQYPSNEVYVQNGVDPRSLDFKETVEQFNSEIKKMNGKSKYDQIVNEIERTITKYENTSQLYKLTKYLDNNKKQENKPLIDLEPLKDNWTLLKQYLHDNVKYENLSSFQNELNNYVNNYANNSVIEKLSAISGNGIENSTTKEFLKPFALFNQNQNLEISADLKNGIENILNDLNLNNLSSDAKNNQLKSALFTEKFYSDFEKMDKSDSKSSEIKGLSYSLNPKTQSYIASKFATLISDKNIFEFIKGKNAANKEISDKLNKLLAEKKFNYWNKIKAFISQILTSNVVTNQEVENLFAPLKLVVEEINNFENTIVLADSGFSDALYAYAFNTWLINNDKYYLLEETDKNTIKAKITALINEIAQMLKTEANKEVLKVKSLATNDKYLESILKAKIQLKDSKSVAEQLLKTSSNNELIKTKEELSKLIEDNIQYQALKIAAAKAKEKLTTQYNNVKNSEVLRKFNELVDSSIVKYDLTTERISADQGDAFYKTNVDVANDWKTFGNFYSLNTLSRDKYEKEINHLKVAKDAYVDQFYKNELDKIAELNKAITDLITKINSTQLADTGKDSLRNIAKQIANISDVKTFEQKVDSLINEFNELDKSIEKVKNVIKDNDIDYKFASDNKKTSVTRLLTSLPKAKNDAINKEMPTEQSLDVLSQQIKLINNTISKSLSNLDGNEKLKEVQDKVTKESLPNFTDEQIKNLKEALKNANDLADANAKVEQYKQLNDSIATAKELASQIESIKSESKYINSETTLKNNYDTSSKALKDILQTYSSKIDQYKNTNPDTWTNNLPSLKNDVDKIINKYKDDLSFLNGDTALRNLIDSKKEEISKFNNISESLKNTFKDKVGQEKTVDAVNSKFEELKAIDQEYGKAIAKITELKRLVPTSDKFEALNGEAEFETLKQHLATYENNFDNSSKGNVDQSKEKVTSLINNISSDIKTIEDKYNEFLQYKETVKNTKINNLTNLTAAQKEEFKKQIDAAKNKSAVEYIVKEVEEIDSVMSDLRQAYTGATDAKSTPKYINASNEPKTHFDKIVAEPSNNPNNVSSVSFEKINSIKESILNATKALDGDTQLNNAKNTAKEEIKKLNNITEKQKEKLNNLIDNQTETEKITDLVSKATSFDKEIQDLKDQKATDATNKTSIKYTQADPELQSKFDTKADEIVAKIGELEKIVLDDDLLNATNTKTEVDKLIQDTKDAYTELNGDTKLSNAKSEANGTLGALNNLNDAVINAFKEKVAQANTLTEVNDIKNKAVTQNDQIAKILESLTAADTLKKNTSVYNKATEEQKQALETAIKDVKDNILDTSAKKMKPNNLTDQLQAKKAAIDSAIKAINELSNEISAEQQKAKETIEKLKNLTKSQKADLKSKVDLATTKDAIDKLVTTATELDKVTKDLKDQIDAGNKVNKEENNYKFADPDKQNAFNEALKAASDALKGGLASKDDAAITKLANDLKDAISKLNGDEKLKANKEAAKQAIEKLDQLSETQKSNLKDKIANAKDDSEVQSLKDAAEKLNKALKAAQAAAQEAEKAKKTNNYTQGSQDKKSALDSNKATLDQEIKKAKETNSFDDVNAINKLTEELNTATQNSNTAKNNLDGDTLLSQARDKANKALEATKHLSPEYKKALKDQITAAQDIATLNDLTAKIPALDAAADNLDQVAKKLAEAIKDPEYANASEGTKAKVAQAEKLNNELLANSLLVNGKEQAAITSAIETNNSALEAIKADEEALANARTKVKEDLASLTNLSQSQVTSITQAIDAANTTAKVTEVITNAQTLNTDMGELIAAYNKFDNAKSETKYTQASETSKNNFDKEYEHKQTYSKDTQTSTQPSEIKKVTEKINTIYNALDGEAELAKAKQEAKDKVGKLSNLDQTAKQAASESIDKVTTKQAAKTIADNESNLDQAITNANNVIKQSQAIKDTPQYKEATDSKQTTFDKAFESLKGAITAAKAQNDTEKIVSTTQDLNDKTNALKSAIDALDGDTNLESAKKVAKAVVEALTNIDSPVKKHFEDEIDTKKSAKEIKAIADQAKATDTATKELIDVVAKANELKAKPDYNVVQEDKKQALDHALETAKNLLTTSGDKLKANTSLGDINNAKEQLSQAIIQASGQADEILKAQNAAKDQIDKLTHLTDQQKQALKHEVSAALTNEAIEKVVTKAKELDKVTEEFKNTIQAATNVDKSDKKYKYADENKQKEFDSELKDAQLELAAGLAGKTKEQINELSKKLADAQKALNGDSKLSDTKTEAKNKINDLNNLTQPQKDAIKNAIDKATSPEDANKLAQKAKELDEALAKAKQAQTAAQEVKKTPKFTEASSETSTPFNSAAGDLDQEISKATTTTDLDSEEKLSALIKGLKENTTKTNDTNNALDGQSRLEKAKAEANGVIDAASTLSPAAIDTFKEAVKNAQTIATVNQEKETVIQAKEAAKSLIDNLAKVKAAIQAAGTSLNSVIAQEANNAITKAEEFLDDNKLKNQADIDEVKKASEKLAQVLDKIQDNVQALKNAQDSAIDTINKLPNLSNTQKQALINEVKASETPEQVNTAVTKAKDLDTAIGKLKDDLNSLTGLKTQDNYKLADPNKQADLDNVANDAENIKNQAGAALDKKAIETLNKKIDDVKAGLNGDANKQEAKAQIDKLNNLNSEQKSAAKDSLNQANTKAELDNKIAQAQALDLAKGNLKIAQDSLIKQFTKPNDSNEAILAGFNNLVKQIQTAKAKLEAANTQASQALASETLNAEEVSQASSLITQAKDLANETIQAVVNNNNAILTAANVVNFTDSSDKETATKAAQKALDKQGNLYQDIANARQVQHLAAIDALTKFKDSLPQDLKASQSFPLTLTGAKEELQASNTKASDDTILAKIKHQLNKDKLAKAYDAASIATISSQMPENLKQEFATEKANALELLKYANTNVDTPKTTYDVQADKLNLLLAKNHLADVIAKGMLAPSSKQLQDALAQAKEALNNNNINQEAVTSASEKLANEIDKAKLYVSINEAQDFVKELQEGNKDLHSNLRDQIVNKLNTQDIPTAQNAANAKDTEAGYNTAAAALDNAVANAKKTIADVYKTLEELRAKIATMPEEAKSAELKAALNETQDINKNSGVVAIENALDMLQHKYATNELDKAIAAAPEINAKYAKLVPSIIEESKAVSNNSHASSQAIKDQLDKQLLNNAKGNALNELAKLNNLNNSQANNLANAIAQGKTLQEVSQTTQQANQLDKAMSQLKDNYNKVDEAYKSGTNLPYEAFFVPADKQQFVKDTIVKAGTVVPINGQVYLNNLPVEVEQLNNDLTNALNLLGQVKGQAKEMEDEFTKLNTKAQNIQVNANKLFNSPKVIQDQIKELDTQIKDLSKLYFNDHAAYMQAGNAKMKQLVEQFSALNDQVEQFSPQVFMKDKARITQAQDLINNNSQYLNDSISQNTLVQFNKATTFAQANEILNNQVKADKELKAKMDQLVTNLTNTLIANTTNDQNTALMQEITATAKNAIVSELKDMKEKTETVANTKNAINTLLSKDTIDKKFKSDLETIDKDVKALPSTLRYNSYPEFVTALQTASATVKNHVDGIKLLISAHDNRNADELAQAIELLNKVDQKNAALAQLMQERNYIGILKDADKKAITNDELASVQALKGTTEYQMASPAIQALVNDDLNNKKALRWWPFAVAASALVWLAGLLAIVLKRK